MLWLFSRCTVCLSNDMSRQKQAAVRVNLGNCMGFSLWFVNWIPSDHWSIFVGGLIKYFTYHFLACLLHIGFRLLPHNKTCCFVLMGLRSKGKRTAIYIELNLKSLESSVWCYADGHKCTECPKPFTAITTDLLAPFASAESLCCLSSLCLSALTIFRLNKSFLCPNESSLHVEKVWPPLL